MLSVFVQLGFGAKYFFSPKPKIMCPKIQLSKDALDYLNETRKWAYFLSIIGLIFCGLIVIFVFSFGTIIYTIENFLVDFNSNPISSFGIGIITATYLLIALEDYRNLYSYCSRIIYFNFSSVCSWHFCHGIYVLKKINPILL